MLSNINSELIDHFSISRLGSNGVPGGIDFSQGTRKPDGRLCIMKEEEVDTIVKEPVLECTHKNVEKCHYTYVTQFTHAKEEVKYISMEFLLVFII